MVLHKVGYLRFQTDLKGFNQ